MRRDTVSSAMEKERQERMAAKDGLYLGGSVSKASWQVVEVVVDKEGETLP